MKNCALLLFSILSFGCQMNKQINGVEWLATTTLPDTDGEKNIGVAGPIAGIIDGKLIVAGGANFPDAMPWDGGVKKYQKEFYIYDINVDGKLNFIGKHNFVDSIAYAANISFENKIISVGGERDGQATGDVFIYSLENDNLIRDNTKYPILPIPLTNGSLTLLDKTLYYVGGENSEIVSNKIFALNLEDNNAKWEVFFELPQALSHTIFLNDSEDNLFVVGGRKKNVNAKSDIYNEVYKISVSTKSIKTLAQLPEPLAAGAGLYYEGNILVFGGDNGSTFHKAEQLMADINLSTDDVIRRNLIEEKNKIQRSHPGFVKNVWQINLNENTWKPSTSIEGESPVTTTALLYNNFVIIPSGEVKAGVRTNQILVGKIK